MLRTRLMLGLLLLLIILFSMGLYSINRWSDLGRRIASVNREDDAVCQGLKDLKHGGRAMNGAMLRYLAGGNGDARDDFLKAEGLFREGQKKLKALPLQADEKSAAQKIDGTFEHYAAGASALLSENRAETRADQTTELAKVTALLASQVDDLAIAHRSAIELGADGPTRGIAEMDMFIGVLMVLALAATVLAWMGLNHGLVEPLRTLTASIQQVGAGDLEQKVPVLDNYELGTLARSFNQMAAQLKEYRISTSEEVSRLNMTIRATLASFPDPIFVLNSEGAVEFRNPEADQLAMQLLFSGVMRLPAKVDEKVERVRATGEDYLPKLLGEAIKFHLNGQDRYLLPRIVLLRNVKKESFGVAVILEDVTRMLLLDDVKSNLIATVSHELKTPLTGLRMAIYLLHEKAVGELNPKQADLIATAKEDSDRLLQTLNDLLDLAKLEQGPAQMALAPIAPGELVNGAVQETRDLAQSAGISVSVELEPGLPTVDVDRQRIAYVFSNFLTNAIKYSPAGTAIRVRGERGAMREGQPGVRFSVLDQGPGIKPEHQEHVFERFYRVPGTTKKGAGLGLSIAREIAIAHGGEMGVICPSPGGSDFFFILPSEGSDLIRETQLQNARSWPDTSGKDISK